MNHTLVQEYERDFYAWLSTNALLLRRGQVSDIDAIHIAEELETMGRREKRELINRLTVLLVHLLKWQFQPARRSKSWRNTILIQRGDLSELLEDSPSLKSDLKAIIGRAYIRAKLVAEDETGLERSQFPTVCPYSFEEIIGEDFYPDSNSSNGQSDP